MITILGLGIAGFIGWKIYQSKKGVTDLLPEETPGTTPEERALQIRSQMSYYAPGGMAPDTTKYLRLQEELELVELETGL